jgi:hypothetical protein
VNADYKLNSDQTVAVSVPITGQVWIPIGTETPKGVKLQLLGKGGVAVYGVWNGKETFWTDWAPIPRRRKD